MGPALPPVDPADVPEGLLPFVSEFELSTGAKIRRMTARDIDAVGWVIELSGYEFMYSDGSVGSRPRFRAYEDLNMPGGDDDLQGAPDSAWQAVQELQDKYSKMLVLPLPQAFAVAVEHGLAKRHAVEGDRVRIRRSGALGTVTNPGTDYDRGHYLSVKLDDGDEGTYRLSAIDYLEDAPQTAA